MIRKKKDSKESLDQIITCSHEYEIPDTKSRCNVKPPRIHNPICRYFSLDNSILSSSPIHRRSPQRRQNRHEGGPAKRVFNARGQTQQLHDPHDEIRRHSVHPHQNQYYMEKDLRYYFQHPWFRLFVAYLVIFCNFLLFAEDPLSHSHTGKYPI